MGVELAHTEVCVRVCMHQHARVYTSVCLLTRVGVRMRLAVAHDTAQACAFKSNVPSLALYSTKHCQDPQDSTISTQTAQKAEVCLGMGEEAGQPSDSTIPHLGLVIHW